jgi:phosphoribosylanthranilate isomerase
VIKMTRVKICGLTREEDVDAAVSAGADAVGFISGIASSPRNLSISRAGSLISRVPPFVTPVLVTSGQSLAENSDLIKRIAPEAIQLYGSLFSPETVRSTFHAHLLKPFPVSRQEGDEGGADPLAKAKEAARGHDALLTDTYKQGVEGGTGLTSDWSVCEAIRKTIAPTPLILSGGLRPENVELAIATVAPYCVDVSSGVESAPGVKDPAKVKAFVSKANSFEERQVAR